LKKYPKKLVVASASHCFPEEPFWNMVAKAVKKAEDKGSLEIGDYTRIARARLPQLFSLVD
jgi:hypothetical protein